jgi:hypothetical protein
MITRKHDGCLCNRPAQARARGGLRHVRSQIQVSYIGKEGIKVLGGLQQHATDTVSIPEPREMWDVPHVGVMGTVMYYLHTRAPGVGI